ncbi:hypothetical protein Hte_000649 [Hypoxylon texense]
MSLQPTAEDWGAGEWINEPQPPPAEPGEPAEPSESSPPPRRSLIDAAIAQIIKENPNQGDSSYNAERREQDDLFRLSRPNFECTQGDTLVIVNFPPGYRNCYWDEWSSKRFPVHSAKLLTTGSRIFADLLSPKQQARFRKRLEQDDALLSHKYVIDLTPSMEGDELAAQLMELSLPSGVRDWWTSKERLGISPYLVSGHDDFCPRHTKVPIDCVRLDKYVEFAYTGPQDAHLPNLDLDDVRTPESRNIDDYCPIRHRANIVRLILAIEGHELVLNSASRVYTLAGVANILDCAGVVRDPICSWLMADPNNEFIDINTEVAFKLGSMVKSLNVTRAAFRILVVEKALDTLAGASQERGASHTIFGRPRADLPDDLETVVQYAAHKLADRVQQTHALLSSDQFYEFFMIGEQRKLMQAGDFINTALSAIPSLSDDRPPSTRDSICASQLNKLLDVYTSLSEKLLEYKNLMLRGAENASLSNTQARDFDRDRRCYVPRTTWNPTSLIYSSFSASQRLLTPCFWESLSNAVPDTYEPHKPSEPLFPDTHEPHKPSEPLSVAVRQFNDKVNEVAYLLRYDSGFTFANPSSLVHFNVEAFRQEFTVAMNRLRVAWTRPFLEAPLHRTNHLALGLIEDEFQFLPLWAGGLDDGTGGVFEPAVPDADMGPIGPGPAYHTGDTVATATDGDASSVAPSDAPTRSRRASTATLTAGRSMAAVPSNIAPTTARNTTSQHGTDTDMASSVGGSICYVGAAAPSLSSTSGDLVMVSRPSASASASAASTATMSESDGFEDVDMYDSDDFDEDAWSQVEEP